MLIIQSNLDSSKFTTPDPWQNSISASKENSVSRLENWQHLYTKTQPLINPAGDPNAPRLIPFKATSERILLEEELKIKNNFKGILEQQLEQALTLLYWLKLNNKQSEFNNS